MWVLLIGLAQGQFPPIPQTFSFLVEGESFEFANQLKLRIFDLVIEVPYTLALSQKMRQDLENILKEWRAYPPFSDATLFSSYLTLTQKGIKNLISATQKQTQLFEYLSPTANHSDSDVYPCKHILQGLTLMDMETVVHNLKKSWEKIGPSWTASSIRTSESQDNAIRIFAELFDSEMASLHDSISQTLEFIDSLSSGIFPESLMGIYQTEDCIGFMIHEEPTVKSCAGFIHGFICRIYIIKPEMIEQVTLMWPVHYHDISMVGKEQNDKFIKSKLDLRYQLLTCDPLLTQKQDLPICSLSPLNSKCSESLTFNDPFAIISRCDFNEHRSYDNAVLLGDGSILVQGQNVKVKTITGLESKLLTSTSPVIIKSKRDVQVENAKGEHYLFPGMTGEITETIILSALDSTLEAALVNKVYWKKFWESKDLEDLINWFLILIQILFIPLTVGSFMGWDRIKRLCKGCKSKKSKKKVNKTEMVRLTSPYRGTR